MEALISKCESLEMLDFMVKEGEEWKKDERLVQLIYERYCDLTKGEKEQKEFGTDLFWEKVLGPESDDTMADEEQKDKTTDHSIIESDRTHMSPVEYQQRSKAAAAAVNKDSAEIVDSESGTVTEPDSEIGNTPEDGDMERGESDAEERSLEHMSPAQYQVGAGGDTLVPNGDDLADYYRISDERQTFAKRFNSRALEMTLTFRDMDTTDRQEEILEQALDEILARARETGDWGSITIEHPGLDLGAFGIRFQPLANLSCHFILREMLRIMQSNKKFRLDDKLRITITSVRMPAGSGRGAKRSAVMDLNEWENAHRVRGGCFIQIKNNDHSCLSRAVVVAKAREDDHPQWNTVRQGDADRKTLQKTMAHQLMNDAGLGEHDGPCGIPEIQKIQDFLAPEYQIKVFQREGACSMVFCGPKAEKVLALYLSKGHFDVITKLPAFFDSSYFCHNCNKGYARKQSHRCQETCPCCYAQPKCIQDRQLILCPDCNRSFANQQCLDNHKIERETTNRKKERIVSSVCTRVKRCGTCRLQYESRNKHECGMRKCQICRKNVERDLEHKCFIQQKEQKPEPAEFGQKKIKGWIFYDMETTQDTVYSGEEGSESFEHQVNLIICQKICPRCYDGVRRGQCVNCGEQTFEGENSLLNFCRWLFAPLNNDCVAFAHNGQGFDNQFILKYLQENSIKPDIIARGLKILTMSVGRLKLLDSMAFVPMALSSLPKAFDLKELAKGYFPHFFNKAVNWDVDQQGLPPATMYGPEGMKPEARKKFEAWYEDHKDDHFNFRAEIVKYCRSDVSILREAMMKFRQSFIESTGVDPFMSTITIASLCMEVFRTNFLKPDTIGLVPHGGYRYKYKYSKIAIKWLKWESEMRGIRIEHALNGGEQYEGKKRLDGRHGNTAFEFYGCAFHGCPKCFKNREQLLPLANVTAHQAYIETRVRAQELKDRGMVLVEMWECDLKREMEENFEMEVFFAGIDIRDPLDPRDAFFGGRTNATTLYHKCDENERIDYVDVCSLYPFVLKYKSYPCGHPLIFTENFEPVTAQSHPYHGLIKCRILPPQNLYHPPLPLRTGKGSTLKLTFPLCAACSEERRQDGDCDHEEEERALDGAWPTPEIYRALELGYRILAIFEVWHYEEWIQFDGRDQNSGMFTAYINHFLALKTQASGWPAWVKSDADKEQFIRDFEEREGVKLEAGKIEKNAAFRALAKLCLNSFWGKLGQSDQLSKTEYFVDPDKFFACIFNPANNVSTVKIITEDMMMVSYTEEENFIELQQNTSPVIAALVTSYARLTLFEYLHQLGRRCLYFDTDSLIYLTSPGDVYQPPIGSFLGDLTNELEDFGEGAFIREFASAGPKNYGFAVWDPTTGKETHSVKIRGFTLSSENQEKLNFSSLRAKVRAFVESGAMEEITTYTKKITRKKDRTVVTEVQKKNYRVVYQKRKVLPDFSTVPYGWKE